MRSKDQRLCRIGQLEDGETGAGLHVLLSLSLAFRFGSRVKVRALANTDTALASAQSVSIIVVGSGMVGRAIIPDCFIPC
jgi:predicted thioesterase